MAFSFRGSSSGILKAYFDIAYYICICPFRFAVQKDGAFLVKTWKPQQILCAVIHILSTLNILIYRWYILLPEVKSKPLPAQYFYVLAHVCSHFLNIMVFKRMWMNKAEFVILMNYLRVTTDSSLAQGHPQDNKRRFTWSNLIQSNLFIGLLCPIYLTMSAAYVNEQVLTPMNCYGIVLPWENTNLTTKAQDIFGFRWLLSNSTNQTVIGLESHRVKNSEIWYGVLATIIEISAITRSVTRYFSSLFLLAGVLTFWNATCLNVSRLKNSYLNRDLTSDIISDTDTTTDSDNTIVIVSYGRFISLSIFEEDDPSLHNWECVYTIYNELRTLSHLINSAYGSIITVTMARAILFNSANMDHALYGQDFVKKILLLLLTVHDTAVFLLAADACSRMDGFKVWLSKDENRKTVPLDQLNVVLNEINTATVGIRGNNMFTVTYSLLWSVVGTVVTYFIICVEARKNL